MSTAPEQQPEQQLQQKPQLQAKRLEHKLKRELGAELLAALKDADVTELLLNPDGALWLERRSSGMEQTKLRFTPAHVENLIGTVARLSGQVIHPACPIVECELSLDGSRFSGLLPPVCVAPCFAIRKRAAVLYSLNDYVAQKIIAPWQAEVIRCAISQRKNLLVAGGTASGKTTLVNALIAEMLVQGPPGERFLLIEDSYELRCAAKNCVHLHTSRALGLLPLTRVSMRLRPDRIIVGELRGAEAQALLKLWNTGHPGGVTTIHAGDAESALIRLELLVEEAGAPPQPQLIAASVDYILYLSCSGQSRKLTQIAEVCGYNKRAQRYELKLLSPRSQHSANSNSETLGCNQKN